MKQALLSVVCLLSGVVAADGLTEESGRSVRFTRTALFPGCDGKWCKVQPLVAFARLRQEEPAFSTDARLAWIDNDRPDAVLSYLKQDAGTSWLCVMNLSKTEQSVSVSGQGDCSLDVGEWKL